MLSQQSYCTGILPVCKPKGKTSFSLVSLLRKLTKVQKIGHAGTLDPFADGVMVLLIGKQFTSLSNRFLNQDKEYLAEVFLGLETETYDTEGKVTAQNAFIPPLEQIETTLLNFQGTILQVPPMFSAKKIDGKKLYELARKGITVEREASPVTLHIELLKYSYPHLHLKIQCSKGTYIRSLAHDIGVSLTCGAHLSALTRTRSGKFTLENCCDGAQLADPSYEWMQFLRIDEKR